MAEKAKRAGLEPMPLDLLNEPLVWLFAEHYRHRDICARLTRLSTEVVCDEPALREVIDFFEIDLPLHIIDEEDDLFPLLRRRCEPEDQIERVLGMLSLDHSRDQTAAAKVKDLMERALEKQTGLACLADAGTIIANFCALQKNHIALENAVVLPIARLRLSDTDLGALSKRLSARRGRLVRTGSEE